MTPEPEERAERPRRRWTRLVGGAILAALILLLLALALAWTERKPIATDIVRRELARRGVPATFRIAAIGARTQRIEDLVIGDPSHPDLTARSAEIGIAIGLHGPEVTTVSAEGVRLRARYREGKLSLGAVDRLLPAPSTAARPITLPAIRLSLRDARVRLDTAQGVFGVALEGEGALQDGFSGRAAIVSDVVNVAGCRVRTARAVFDIAIADHAPMLDGPVRARMATCGTVRADDPVIAIDARLAPGFDHWRGGARIEATTVDTPAVGITHPAIQIGFDGDRSATRGGIDSSAAALDGGGVRVAPSSFSGKFVIAANERSLVGHADLRHVAVAASVAGRLRAIGGAARAAPGGPVIAALASSLADAARDADLGLDVALLDRGPAGAALEIEHLAASSESGAHAAFGGGIGVRLATLATRIQGRLSLGGGGLPASTIEIRQPGPDAPISARATIAAMAADGARIAPGILTLVSDPAGGIRFAAPLVLDGAIGRDGRVDGLRATIAGRYRGGVLRIGEACLPITFDALRVASFRLGRTTERICPIGDAIALLGSDGVRGGARMAAPTISGAIGTTPLAVSARDLSISLPDLRLIGHAVRARIGAGADPTTLEAGTLDAATVRGGMAGGFAAGGGKVTNVPFIFSGAAGRWRFGGGGLTVQAKARVADAAAGARFHPLAVPDLSLRLAGSTIIANGHLAEPKSAIMLARVTIEHDLAAAAGSARIAVPALVFGKRLQPEAITPLTLGIVANVAGTIDGSGLVRWSPKGVTSTGAFSTTKLDLAAAFGQVSGISGTIRFDDLIGLTTPPGQEAHVAAINPGIEVDNGVIRYQLLPERRIGIESGRWPFAGGALALEPTVLDFAEAAVRRMTLDVTGLDGAKFIDQMKFENIAATGIFDGTLPLVFDKDGGRIVGGSLVARPPGGTISYVGDVSNAQLGTFGKLAFDALKSLRYKTLAISLDGSLDGEVVSQIKVNGVNQQPVGAKIGPASKRLTGLPFRFNITVKAPFRGLMNSARTFADPSALIRAQATPPAAAAGVQPK